MILSSLFITQTLNLKTLSQKFWPNFFFISFCSVPHLFFIKVEGCKPATLKKTETVARRCSVKKIFLKISKNSQEKTGVGVSSLITFKKKETLTQAFSCKFCGTFKTTYFIEHLR